MNDRLEFRHKIENEIEKRFTEEGFKVKDLVNNSGLCRSSFWEIFNNVFGIIPIHMIECKRLVRAMKLIMIEQRLFDVAAKSGFSNIRSINRAFKRQFKINPKEVKTILVDYAQQNRSDFCNSCMYKNRSK